MKSNKNVTKHDIMAKITDEFKVTQNQAADYVATVLSLVGLALSRDEEVKISNFGTFFVRNKNSRIGRNPHTNEIHEIKARKTVSFRASTNLKDVVNNNNHNGRNLG